MYQAFAPRLRAVLTRRVHDHHLAEDLVQETFVRAWTTMGRYDPSRPMWPWLNKIASNICVDAYRARPGAEVLCARVEVVAGDLPEPGPGPEELFEAEERRHAVAT